MDAQTEALKDAGCEKIFTEVASEAKRYLLRERTQTGLKVARAKGRIGGRPRQMTDDKINAVRELLATVTPVKDAAAALGASVPTLIAGYQEADVEGGLPTFAAPAN